MHYSSKNLRSASYQLLVWFTLLISGCFVIALFLPQFLWSTHPNVMHSAIELCCFMVCIFCFLVIWQTWGRPPQLSLLLAYGFLAIGIFDLLHLYFYPGLKLFPPGYYDLYSRMFAVSCLLQVIAAGFLITRVKINLQLNRWVMLIAVIAASIALASFIYYDPLDLPTLRTGSGITQFYTAYRWFIILALFCCLLINSYQEKGINHRNWRFQLALMLAVIMHICLISSQSSLDFYNIVGHLLKLSCYLCVFVGISSRAFIDPYNHLQNILNRLPLALVIYNPDQTVHLLNDRLIDIHTNIRSASEVEKAFSNPHIIPPHPSSIKINAPFIRIPQSNGQMLLLQHNQITLPDGSCMHLYIDVSYEQELTGLRLQTQTILNSIPNPVLVLDAQKSVVAVNPALDNLLPIKVNPGDNFNQLVHRLTCIVTNQNEGNQASNTTSYEISLVGKEDKVLNMLINYSTITGMQDEIMGYVIVGQDITPLKAQHEVIKQREKLAVLGEMAAGIVHEIKNPLTSIKGFSQMLLSHNLSESSRSYVELILESANDVNQVVSDFLSFARPRPPRLTAVSLNQLLNSVRYLLQSNSLMKEINVEYDLSTDELLVYADRQQLRQVLLNLSKNSLEALEGTKNAQLRFATRPAPSGQEMIISISDNGPGIALEMQSYLGTPFFTTKNEGTGLGLSICYQIIKEHGGRIEVTSRPGEGATFTITLPCLKNNTINQQATG